MNDRLAHLNQLLASLEEQLAGLEKALILAPLEEKARLRLLIQEKQQEMLPYAEEKTKLESESRTIAPNLSNSFPANRVETEIPFPIVGGWSAYGGLQVNMDPTNQTVMLSGVFTSAAGYVKEQSGGFALGGKILILSIRNSGQSSFDQYKMFKLEVNGRYVPPLDPTKINHNDVAYINAGDGTVSFQLPEQVTKLEFVFWNACLNHLEISGTLKEPNSPTQSAMISLDPLEPLSVFISYAHRDEDLKDELVVHLATLKRQGKIKAWQDRDIEAGAEWDQEIKANLEAADIILLLITPRFLASDYCFDLEMQRAVDRHNEGTAKVIPIILKPCDWQETPFSKLQGLPKDCKPVTTWNDRDEAFLNVVQGIRKAVESLQAKK